MKQTKALSIRADLQNRIGQLESRLKHNAKVQKSDGTNISLWNEMKQEKVIMFIWACIIAIILFLLISLCGEMSEERWIRIGF